MKVRGCRPSGGLGDVLMCLAAFKGVRLAYPDAEVVYFSHKDYHEVLDRCPDIDRWVHTCKPKMRRPRLAPLDGDRYPYLNNEPGPWAFEFDLWCPAWSYEHDSITLKVRKPRIQSFAEEAGVWSLIQDDPRPRLRLTHRDHVEAEQWLKSRNLKPERTVGWQVYPTCSSRRWPEVRINETAKRLLQAGYRSVAFDCVPKRVSRTVPDAVPGVNMRLGVVAAVLSKIRLCVAPDSAFLHLCGCDGVDTPTLGLFGKTAGEVWQSPYPLGHWLQGEAVDCEAPCWHRFGRGHDTSWCRPKGCSALLNISTEHVVEAIVRIIDGGRVEDHVSGGFDGEVRKDRRVPANTPPVSPTVSKPGVVPTKSPEEAPGAGPPLNTAEPDQQLDRLIDPDLKAIIICDAFPWDSFREVTGGRGEPVWSPAHYTTKWLEVVYPYLKDRKPFVFSANPMVEWSSKQGMHAFEYEALDRTLWSYHTGDWIPTVHPEALAGAVRDRLRNGCDKERLYLVWFVQPHCPYIGETRLEGDKVAAGLPYDELRRFAFMPRLDKQYHRGELDPADLKAAYLSNGDLVWQSASQLAEWLATRLRGRVAVTSDHGELLGEDGKVGHFDDWADHPLLHRVPWIEFTGRVMSPGLEARMKALGYHE